MQVDLTNCDREPIHVIGRIQSFGMLFAVSSDWIITHCSTNVETLVGRPVDELIGCAAYTLFDQEALHRLRTRLQMLGSEDSVERVFSVDLFGDERLFDIAMHRSGRSMIIEAEPTLAEDLHHYVNFVRPMADRVKQGTGTLEMCNIAARQLRALTGFDRVMVYHFADDGSGEVISESRSNGIDSFIGLHFPATDIPQQARRLYMRNMLRIISDVGDPTVEIVPHTDPDGEPLDLTMSTLRAVSPVHIEYLRNMGVQASLSISIMREGKLWGLFACHHYRPIVLSYPVRTAAELFGELFAYMLDQSENRQSRAHAVMSAQIHDALMVRLAEGGSLVSDFEAIGETIHKVIPHDGMISWIDGQFVASGSTPTQQEFQKLARFLNTTGTSRIWSTDCLAARYTDGGNFCDRAAGLLAIPVSRTPRDYIVLFRGEIARTVRWAGNPEKPIETGPLGDRLTPRKSFEEWKQHVVGHCAPWTIDELQCAEQIRVTMIEVILRLTDSANREREQAGKRQEILIAELNHRVRNILSLVRGLITQAKPDSPETAEFAELLGSRIHALARAHDQLTKSDWKPTPIRNILSVETEAYCPQNAERVRVEGVYVIINAAALTTLALVFHELLTNSVKYGALSVPQGSIQVRLDRAADNSLHISWQEAGGPQVTPPTSRGFGSTLIERSIPHELGGSAELLFLPEGLVARFVIPAMHVDRFSHAPLEAEKPMGRASPDPTQILSMPATVLVVEDNILIAMETEEVLRTLGVDQVHIAASVQDALALISANDFGAAILDVNLGIETSEPVAEKLRELAVPFLMSTGYGDSVANEGPYRGAPLLTKPYTKGALQEALSRALASSSNGAWP